MTRITGVPASKKRRKKVLKKAKGFWGDRKNHNRITKDAVMKAMAFNYEHRKQKKRNFRSLWITRIGVGAKANGISYSKLIYGLNKLNNKLDRKMLAYLAAEDSETFAKVVEQVKATLK